MENCQGQRDCIIPWVVNRDQISRTSWPLVATQWQSDRHFFFPFKISVHTSVLLWGLLCLQIFEKFEVFLLGQCDWNKWLYLCVVTVLMRIYPQVRILFSPQLMENPRELQEIRRCIQWCGLPSFDWGASIFNLYIHQLLWCKPQVVQKGELRGVGAQESVQWSWNW